MNQKLSQEYFEAVSFMNDPTYLNYYQVKKTHLLLAVLLTFITEVYSQKNVNTFGFVVKPIFPSKYFRTGPKNFEVNNIDFNIAQQSGFSAGGIVRHGITKSLSFETGINYVKRLYDLKITDSAFVGKSNFKIVGYEIPMQVLVFVQLSKDIWMNAALGPSIDIYPSDIKTLSSYFVNITNRNSRSVFNTGILANLGWEWRTKKDGYIYFGACYHRSFNDIYNSTIGYIRDPKALTPYAQGSIDLSGDYLTFDIRYYFHEDPDKKIIKRRSKE